MTTRPAFLFDPDRCTSCEACRVACGIENNEGRDTGWRTVMTFNPERQPDLPTRHLSLACNHCDTPACAIGCPANAYHRDEITGAVILDGDKCIGCRYCSWTCPYDAPVFSEEQQVMTKCSFCSPRVAAGGQPACTTACPTGALAFGVHSAGDPEPAYLGIDPTGLGPSLKISKPRLATAPVIYPEPEKWPDMPMSGRVTTTQREITVRSEWALLLFTLVMPALVAWFCAGSVRTDRSPSPVAFTAAGGFAMIVSMLHLGKPLRAWRAVLNVRTSWLSREIVFASLFLGLSTLSLSVPALPPWVGWSAVAAGIGLAISIDGVYRTIPRSGQTNLHSAEALPAVALLVGVATGVDLVTWSAAAIKTVAFVMRKRRGVIAPIPIARLLFLAAASFLGWPYAFAAALAGEAIDRAMFYDELEPTTPARRIAEEMVKATQVQSMTSARMLEP